MTSHKFRRVRALMSPCVLPWAARFNQEEYPLRDLPAGYGPSATASSGPRLPTVTTLRYGGPMLSGGGGRALLLCGCDDGAVTVRPAQTPGAYARVQAHDGDSTVAAATCSWDGDWIVSGDSDGLLAVNRLNRTALEVRTKVSRVLKAQERATVMGGW